ncbi:hypothetical protein BS50DRAFT_150383 [Corynespora cassiicola Philippines]|uniref:Uncharacterized protein n=1 Tax=Corynespora cassiicola Philippines TaxID=1448308 RepID=A0A2T2N7K5_CORCC|nr:hypothetical protein BS50DRAFT_150383 [Corynespora cassiicola Philippines]
MLKIAKGVMKGTTWIWTAKFKTLWNEHEIKKLAEQPHKQQSMINMLLNLLQMYESRSASGLNFFPSLTRPIGALYRKSSAHYTGITDYCVISLPTHKNWAKRILLMFPYPYLVKMQQLLALSTLFLIQTWENGVNSDMDQCS